MRLGLLHTHSYIPHCTPRRSGDGHTETPPTSNLRGYSMRLVEFENTIHRVIEVCLCWCLPDELLSRKVLYQGSNVMGSNAFLDGALVVF